MGKGSKWFYKLGPGVICPRGPFWVITTLNTPRWSISQPVSVQFLKLSNGKKGSFKYLLGPFQLKLF